MTKIAKTFTFLIAAVIYAGQKIKYLNGDLEGNYKPSAKQSIEDAKIFVAEAQEQKIMPEAEDFQ